VHRLAWHDPDRSEGEVRESLVLALLDAGETVMLQDEDERYLFIANLPAIWGEPDRSEINIQDSDIFGSAIAEILKKAKADLVISGNRTTVEIPAGDDQIFQFQLFATVSSQGQKVTKTTIREVTVERRREQLLRTLLREVSHRSRNLMAIIQSLSDQTARFSSTIEEFLRKFRGRLFALAQSQDLLTDSDWRGASLFDLLRQQLELYLPEYPNLVKMDGEEIFLNPNGTLYLGLAFHELVVNTVSHGRNLTQPQQITVTCKNDGTSITLCWAESISNGNAHGAAVEKPRSNFGSVVLEKVVPVALNGQAKYEISDTMITYGLTFPITGLA
jgi:two-component sensor histidine kinase